MKAKLLKGMYGVIITSALCVGPCYASAAHYSNAIIFGDSLSDIGNMPESQDVVSPATGYEAENLYVPISNPIDVTTNPFYTPPLSTESLHYPTLVKDYQAYQPLLGLGAHSTQKAKRIYHSYNWPLFFVNEAYSHQLLDTPTITPWYLTQQSKPNAQEHGQVSVDYAFAGAVSENSCYDFTYHNGNPNCSSADIYSGQETYRTGQTQVTTVEVPGFQKQVTMFVNDQQKATVVTDANSLYVVMTGNNDLNKALISLANISKDPKDAIAALRNVYAGGIVQGIQGGIQTLISHGAHHVVVIGMYDPGKTPYLATDISKLIPKMTPLLKGVVQAVASSTSLDFNAQLQLMVASLRQKNPGIDIKYFDTFARLNTLHDQAMFSHDDTKYQACVDQLSENNLPSFVQGQGLSCVKNTGNADHSYMFWNMTHMTAKTNEYLADQLYKSLS